MIWLSVSTRGGNCYIHKKEEKKSVISQRDVKFAVSTLRKEIDKNKMKKKNQLIMKLNHQSIHKTVKKNHTYTHNLPFLYIYLNHLLCLSKKYLINQLFT